MSDEAGWRVLNWAWERKDEILQFLSRLRAWFRNEGASASTPGILILGPGGTGKTTLARLLSGDVDLLLDPPGTYQASVGMERYELLGTPTVEIVVPPGQSHRQGATWAELLAAVAAGKFRGIILVTAYGHQSLARDSYQQHPLYAGDKDAFRTELLARQRADELAILDQLTPVLGVAPCRLWLLSIVAKQDLWWQNRHEVEKHYREGDYQSRLAAIFGEKGHRDRRHELCCTSLVIQNWVTAAGERLKPNAEGYDQALQVAAIRRLLETVDALRRWEVGG
jgi:hypothetical protein